MAVTPRKGPASGRPYKLGFDHLCLDPYTGDILGRRRHGDYSNLRLNFMPLMYDLHTSLVMGSTGTLDSFAGFYLTLPRGSASFGGVSLGR